MMTVLLHSWIADKANFIPFFIDNKHFFVRKRWAIEGEVTMHDNQDCYIPDATLERKKVGFFWVVFHILLKLEF